MRQEGEIWEIIVPYSEAYEAYRLYKNFGDILNSLGYKFFLDHATIATAKIRFFSTSEEGAHNIMHHAHSIWPKDTLFMYRVHQTAHLWKSDEA
jgi:hypothetical protein